MFTLRLGVGSSCCVCLDVIRKVTCVFLSVDIAHYWFHWAYDVGQD